MESANWEGETPLPLPVGWVEIEIHVQNDNFGSWACTEIMAASFTMMYDDGGRASIDRGRGR